MVKVDLRTINEIMIVQSFINMNTPSVTSFPDGIYTFIYYLNLYLYIHLLFDIHLLFHIHLLFEMLYMETYKYIHIREQNKIT